MSFRHNIHLALRHDLVRGRGEELIHSSVTQIDLHDFSRLAMTYDLAGFHCVTAMQGQHQISQDILRFWLEGQGKDYNPDRVTALGRLALHHDAEAMIQSVTELHGQEPLLIATSAQSLDKTLDYSEFRHIMANSGRPAIIQFGTSWGLSPEQVRRCDWALPPIQGQAGYNHLSVRCAAAIIVDRLCHS